jgi:hypothetical protein
MTKIFVPAFCFLTWSRIFSGDRSPTVGAPSVTKMTMRSRPAAALPARAFSRPPAMVVWPWATTSSTNAWAA